MEQGSSLNEDADISDFPEVNLSVPLKRVFNIDITICRRCGKAVRIVASIEDPLVIKRILDYLNTKFSAPASGKQLPEPRAPPQASLFDY